MVIGAPKRGEKVGRFCWLTEVSTRANRRNLARKFPDAMAIFVTLIWCRGTGVKSLEAFLGLPGAAI
jgi:hypothetical protein